MFSHILIPTDGSAAANIAAKKGIALAKKLGARATAYYSIEPVWPGGAGEGYTIGRTTLAELDRRAREIGEEILGAMEKRARSAGVPFDSVCSNSDAVYKGIIDVARKKRCDAIVMASRGRGAIGSLLLGSVTSKVLAHSRIPVVVFR
jgi:nucleotide-binding universal stress UspA family protein